ncbi:MAG TPA: xanthine dehydrogenase family protein molybdopterin-binding subunit [Candidatus Dormibacteraeota bacterium]|nr:xanthine dehydrogenase family protein molybdopterin-binding subunit [Candidatus Dormibacteraeota bacterium]
MSAPPPGRLLVHGDVPPPLGRDLAVIGRSINRRDALEKVTGQAVYSSDMTLPGMLHAKILRCPHAHARIRRIDTSRAAALPGVHAVLSLENTRGWHTYWYMIAQPAFPEEIAYAGQEVALVAAETVDIALHALGLIEVEYEVLPAALTPREAMKPDAPRVPVLDVERPREGNVQQPIYVRARGDVDRGLAEADVVSESHFTLPTQYHVDIQTRCCIADWDGLRLTVYEASQGVWNVKRELAKSLGLEEDRVRVVVQNMGGGFGSKAGAQRVIHYAARLAMLAGRPVRLELTRPEEFLSHPRRYAGEVTMRLGARRDGTLTAIDAEIVLDIGSGSLYAGKYTMTLHQISELYRCPSVRVRIVAVYTNTSPTGPQRGVLDPIATFSTEAAIDDLAARLGMDPLALRMKNYAEDFQGLDDTTPALPYTSKHLDACLATVADAIGWADRDRPAAGARGSVRRGVGIAAYCIERGGYAPFSAKADVVARPDGSVEMQAGVVEIGAGQITILPMIAAEELGLPAERIRIHHGDTDGTHYAPSSHASRITSEVGPAVLQAAAMVRGRLFELVAPQLEVSPLDLVAVDERIHVRGVPARGLSFTAACALMSEPEIRATGSRAPNPDDVIFRLFGAHGAEVLVDVETGELRVVRIVCSHDIGRPINPKLVESQQYGGAVMGLGYGLYEEAELDGKTGVLLTPDVHQYRVPTALETPTIEARNVESEDAFYPYSAKPVGEAPLVGVMPAVRNALRHALGFGIDALPLTPARILEAIAARRSADAG